MRSNAVNANLPTKMIVTVVNAFRFNKTTFFQPISTYMAVIYWSFGFKKFKDDLMSWQLFKATFENNVENSVDWQKITKGTWMWPVENPGNCFNLTSWCRIDLCPQHGERRCFCCRRCRCSRQQRPSRRPFFEIRVWWVCCPYLPGHRRIYAWAQRLPATR